MANQGWNTVGEETQGNNGGGQPQEDKLDFLATPEGETEIRVLDEAPYYYQEWWSVQGNEGKGTSIPYKGKGKDLLEKANQEFMAKVFAEADAKGLKNGSDARKKFVKTNGYDKQPFGKLKNKYLIHVLERATGEVKLLDKGKGLFEKLKGFALHKYHGDLRTYDVTIVRKGNGWMDTEYDAMACPEKTPLTEEEIALYEAKKVDLHKLKGGEDLTPEQCLFVANGGAWSEVNNVGQAPEEAPSGDELPEKNEGVRDDANSVVSQPTVDTSKEGALSDEDLKEIKF